MVDAERLRRRLAILERRLARLRRLRQLDRATYLDDLDAQALVERHLQVAIQAAIDVALHVVAEAGGSAPEDYGAAFTALAGLDVISDDLGGRLRLAAGMRNVLVHGYAEVEPLLVWESLDDLGDLEELAQAVDRLLRNSE